MSNGFTFTQQSILTNTPDDARLGPVHHVWNRVAANMPDTLAAWEARAEYLRRHILSCAGLNPLPQRTPLEADVWELHRGDGFRIAAYRFQSFPGFWVCGNLFIPDGEGPFPAVLNPHGHWKNGRIESTDVGSVPMRGVGFARMGAVALTIDMVGYNDTDQVPHRFGSPVHKLWGYGPLFLQLWNLIRAVDFLQELEFVEPERIGCTGASGGGTQTFMLTAVDERIKVAAPVNMVSAHMHGGCACENAPMLRLNANNMEFAAMAAPRPLLMVSASGDWTAETAEVEFPAVRSIYALYGQADRIEHAHFDAPHNYNLASRLAVYRFFAKWLLNRPDIDPAQLEVPLPCAPEGLRLYPAHPRPQVMLQADEVFDQVKQIHRSRLDAVIQRAPALKNVHQELSELLEWQEPSAEELRMQIAGETTVHETTLKENTGKARKRLRLTLGTRRRGEAIPIQLEWDPALPTKEMTFGRVRRAWPQAKTCRLVVGSASSDSLKVPESPVSQEFPGSRSAVADDHAIICRVEPFLTGSYLSPRSQAGRNTGVTHFEDYNLTDDAWRLVDIALAASWLHMATGSHIHLEAHGETGPWGLGAMALSPRIASATLELSGLRDDEPSMIDRLYIPHLMRLGGLRLLFHLCAPRPLEVIGAEQGVYELFEEAYLQK